MPRGFPPRGFGAGAGAFGDGDLRPGVRGVMIALAVGLLVSLAGARAVTALGGPNDFLGRYVALTPGQVLHRFYVWQLATFVVLPVDTLWGLLDILMLYMFGRQVEERFGTRKLLALFFGSAAFGGLLYVAIYPGGPLVVGAGCGIGATIVAFTLAAPRQRILFLFILPMEMWLATAIFLALEVAMYAGGGLTVLPVLGGAAFGALFFRYHDAFERTASKLRERSAARAAASERDLQARVDEILEKINRDGMAALDPEERRTLERASRASRARRR